MSANLVSLDSLTREEMSHLVGKALLRSQLWEDYDQFLKALNAVVDGLMSQQRV